MKKAVSFILAIILCLSLCACGSNNSNSNSASKYAGTYNHEGSYYDTIEGGKVYTNEELILNNDGTGTLVVKSLTDAPNFLYSKYVLKKGDVLLSYDLKWNESDGYLVITGTGKQYFEVQPYGVAKAIGALLTNGISVSISESYELKGNKLFEVGSNYAYYTKVS